MILEILINRGNNMKERRKLWKGYLRHRGRNNK
jgi:hypothetical protein